MTQLPFFPADSPLVTSLALVSMLGMLMLVFSRRRPLWFSLLMCSFNGGMCFFILSLLRVGDGIGRYGMPVTLILSSVLCFTVYTLTYYILTKFVNWVFFDDKKKLQWSVFFSRAKYWEAILLWLCFMMLSLGALPMYIAIILSAIFLIFAKLWFFQKTRKVFFPNFLASIHFFTYLCALEIVPILILYGFSVQILLFNR